MKIDLRHSVSVYIQDEEGNAEYEGTFKLSHIPGCGDSVTRGHITYVVVCAEWYFDQDWDYDDVIITLREVE